MNKRSQFFKTFVKQMKAIVDAKMNVVFLILILNMIFASLIPLLQVYIPRIGINLIEQNASQKEVIIQILIICSLLLLSLVIVNICGSYANSRFLGIRLSEFRKVIHKQLNVPFEKLEDASYMDYYNSSLEALSGDNMGFQGVYHELFALLPFLFSIILYSFFLFNFSFVVTIIVLLSGVVTLLINNYVAKYFFSKRDEESKAIKKMNYFHNTSFDFSYGKEIIVYHLQDKIKKDYHYYALSYLDVLKSMYNREFLVGLIELFFLLLQDGLAYYLIIVNYFNGVISLGEVSFYVGLIIALKEALKGASLRFSNMVSAMRLSMSYFAFMEDKSLISNDEGKEAFPKDVTLKIEFKNVSFKYPRSDKYIFKNLNLTINSQEKLAIVGVNGAGKTTLCKLLVGLYKVNEGEILINGINVNEFSRKALTKMFGFVFQDVNIYACSLLENVVGDEKDQIPFAKECLRSVGLEEKILSLPNQYDTQMLKTLDPKGVSLSGGENQKIAIARALYKDANMIILDEPTAALDALKEAEIYQSFDKLVKHKTAIYISHRLSSTKFCDHIALFDQTGLKEYGTHDELMKLKGLYYQMFMTQGKYYRNGGDDYE